MKKAISVLMALTISLYHLSVISVALYEETDCLSVENFTSKLVALNSGEIFESSFSDNARVYFSDGDEHEETNNNSKSIFRLVAKAECKLDPLDSVGYIYGYNDLHILQFDNLDSFEKAKEYYSSLSCVEYVEEDSVFTTAELDEGVVVESAVDYPTSVQSNLFGYTNAKVNSASGSVDVAVVDSGVQHDHDFLKGRVVDTGFNSISDNGTAYDDRGHGTHVAGIIVANTNSNVTVHAYKVLGANGEGTSMQVALGIDAAIEDGVDIINLSMQMSGFSQTLYDAVLRAYNAGIAVVVAAGNAGVDLAVTPYSPGSFTEAISVMSCSNARRISSTSNYGTLCDFAAPGENILSTYINNTYKVLSGTSMAAPFICAAASYLLAEDSSLSPDAVATRLSAQTEWCYGSPAGKCVYPAAQTKVIQTSSAPTFDLKSTSFLGTITVSLSCSEEGADIFYSLDGEDVLREYTQPLEINKTTKITAVSLLNGKKISNSVSETYTLIDGDITDFVVDDNGCLIGYKGNKVVITVPDYINSKEVVSVSAEAFSYNTTIEEIFFGESLVDVFDSAFVGCEMLSKFVAPALENISDNAFENCLKLNAVEAPSVVLVGANAFKNCSNLYKFTSIYTEKIGDYAFYGCSSLKMISLNYLASVGLYAFANCSSLVNFNANTLATIDISVLDGCVALETIALGAVEELPLSSDNGRLFGGLPMLNSFVGNNITYVPSYAFCDLDSLESVTMCALTSIGDYAFSNTALCLFKFGPIKHIGKYAFENTDINDMLLYDLVSLGEGAFSNCQKLNYITFPQITYIPANTFYNCTSLSEANLSSCVDFGSQSFMYCSNLSALERGNETTIGDRAFYGCCSFVPEDLLEPVSIGSEAFYGTQPVTDNRLEPNTLKYVSEDAFSGVDIDILILGNVIELYDVPDEGIVLVGSKVTSCSIPSDENSTIYSPKGTLVSKYCINNNLNYIEYNSQTAILDNPESILYSQNQELYFNVLGFNLVGRWYWCDDNSDETSLYCQGAVAESSNDSIYYYRYNPINANKNKYLYCVVTSSETDGHTLKFRSSFVFNKIPTYSFSDENTYIDYFKFKNDNIVHKCICSEERTIDNLLDSVDVVNGTIEITPTFNQTGDELIGTGSTLVIYDMLGMVHATFYLMILGDINGDGFVDVLDSTKMGLFINGFTTIDYPPYSLACDVNRDDIIDNLDYQAVVNKAVS